MMLKANDLHEESLLKTTKWVMYFSKVCSRKSDYARLNIMKEHLQCVLCKGFDFEAWFQNELLL